MQNGIVRRYPRIRFVLSHTGGFVPYASHRMATTIAHITGREPDVLEDFQGLHFDTALSSSTSALPTLLAFAQPDHVVCGSDWPYSPTLVQYFANTAQRTAINRDYAASLFPRLAGRTGT